MSRPTLVVPFPHPALLRPVAPVTKTTIRSSDFQGQLQSLKGYMGDFNMLSICAQKRRWGVPVALVKTAGHVGAKPLTFINPKLVVSDHTHSIANRQGMWENCSSMLSLVYWVDRPGKITLQYSDEWGVEKEEDLSGFAARLLQHEMDHMAGESCLSKSGGASYVVTASSMGQRDLWMEDYPSKAAYATPEFHVYHYGTGDVTIADGCEWIVDALKRNKQMEHARLQGQQESQSFYRPPA